MQIIKRIEKDENDNPTKMQLVVYSSCNKTEIMVCAYQHTDNATKELFDGTRTIGQAEEIILKYLASKRLIGDADNWEYSADASRKLSEHHRDDENKLFMHFGWRVKQQLLRF